MQKRSNVKVCFHLIHLVRPLTGFMILAVLMGFLGHLCATAIPVLGGIAFLSMIDQTGFSLTGIFIAAALCALFRGILHYGEQGCNHYIAFKLLALIRDKVFGALRKLCPAKLEGRHKGDLISVITSDIELLEVFYAHTISPILIAILMSITMCIFLGTFHVYYALLGIVAYFLVGVVVPVITSRRSEGLGQAFRDESGSLSAFVLDCLRGIDEILQFGQGKERNEEMQNRTGTLIYRENAMKREAGNASAMTNTILLSLDLTMLCVACILYIKGAVTFGGVLVPLIAFMSSFGPVIALANLGSGLQNTFAAGNRVLDILEESPETAEVTGEASCSYEGMEADDVTFSYGSEPILEHVSVGFPENKVIGISGKSGSGKSTLLKLLMRFWKTDGGTIRVSGRKIDQVNTKDLRNMQSYVTQETHLFHDSIANNLRIAKKDATKAQMEEACKKAAVHDFICSLPDGYDTQVGELGSELSGGERQRLGLARAFLHDAPMVFLDEPTSNLDSLNEAVILQSIEQSAHGKTVVLVSHRPSTLALADEIYNIEGGRSS